MAESVLVLGCLILLASIFGLIVWRAPQVTIAILLLQVLLSSAAINFNPTFLFFGYHFYLTDTFTIFLLASGLLRKLSKKLWSRSDTIFTLFSLNVIFGTWSYCQIFPFQTSITQHRELLYAVAVYFWAASIRVSLTRVFDLFIGISLIAAILQNILYLKNGFGSAADGYYDPSLGWVSARPLYASGALIMVCGLIALVARPGHWTPTKFFTAIFLFASVVLSQHRSVWVATLAAAFAWLVASDQQKFRRASVAVFSTLILSVTGIFLYLFQTNLSSVGDSATNTSTLLARDDYWSERLAVPRPLIEWLSGGLFGPSSVQLDPRFSIAAHNMYVELISTYGILGLTLFVTIIFMTFPRFNDQNRAALSMMILAVSAYGFFYSWPAWAFLFLGFGTVLKNPESLDVASVTAKSQQVRNATATVAVTTS